ncbi:MAG: hypothetical protein N3E45_16095 [Oscillatoriaceae bacterium SKW80]|nr:hypothetical protein [Oscillatoriaceae bacterium SKW80]
MGNLKLIVNGQEKSEVLLAASFEKRLITSERKGARRLTAKFSKNTKQRQPRCLGARKKSKSPPIVFQLGEVLRQSWENWQGGKTKKWPEKVLSSRQALWQRFDWIAWFSKIRKGRRAQAKMIPRISQAKAPASNTSKYLPQQAGQPSRKFPAFRSKLSEQDKKINIFWRPTQLNQKPTVCLISPNSFRETR